jgi:hypothetical protein
MAIKTPEPHVPEPSRRHRPLLGRYPAVGQAERRELFETRSFKQLKQIFPDQKDEVLRGAAARRADLLESVYKKDSVDLDEVRANSAEIMHLIHQS